MKPTKTPAETSPPVINHVNWLLADSCVIVSSSFGVELESGAGIVSDGVVESVYDS